MKRRALIAAAASIAAARRAAAGALGVVEAVVPGRPLAFPGDHGAHPGFRIEWWYLTGWLDRDGTPWGFQFTLFRSRTSHAPENPSRFAPHQLLLAHAAVTSREVGLRHTQAAARAGFGIANADTRDTDVTVPGFRLRRDPADVYRIQVDRSPVWLDLTARPAGPPLLQGDEGFSRKGPDEAHASYYYSRPRLALQGTIGNGSVRRSAEGIGWLDHEWSSAGLPAGAAGWDWVGLNLDDETSLVAFRVRGVHGETIASYARWPGIATTPGTVAFAPLRHWRSPRTGAVYPVATSLGVAGRTLRLEPLVDDQEIDARATTGNIYWEGAVRVFEHAREIGVGYLELTGYAGPQRL